MILFINKILFTALFINHYSLMTVFFYKKREKMYCSWLNCPEPLTSQLRQGFGPVHAIMNGEP